jgi:hypothetical protein
VKYQENSEMRNEVPKLAGFNGKLDDKINKKLK